MRGDALKTLILFMATGLVITAPGLLAADPSLECSITSDTQVAIGDCLTATEASIDGAVKLAFGFAHESAAELDDVTGRDNSVKALSIGQNAWTAYRDAHCDFVGTTFGGGSGTGIAIQSCRIELGRLRTSELMTFTQ